MSSDVSVGPDTVYLGRLVPKICIYLLFQVMSALLECRKKNLCENEYTFGRDSMVREWKLSVDR